MCSNMVTIEDLIKLKDFSKHATLVSKKCDCSRVVSHITIMEAPDLNEWVTGGEFVLTTWYSLSKDPQLAENSFRKLAPKIAAIGIKTHRFIESIPDNILKIAEQFKLPVFEIKRDTLFRNLVNIIAIPIQNYQLNMLVEIESFYKELLEASACSDDINKILTLLSSKTNQPCALLDNNLNIIGQCGNLMSKNDFNISRVYLIDAFINDEQPISYLAINDLAVFPCFIRKKIVGFIFVPSVVLKSDKQILTFQQATSFFSVRLWSMYEDIQKKKALFLKQFCGEDSISKEYLLSDMHEFGINTNKNMLACIIYSKNITNNLYLWVNLNFQSKLIVVNNDIISIIYNGNEAFDKMGKLFETLKKHSIKYIVISSESTRDVDTLRHYYKLITKSLKVLRHTKLWGIWKMDNMLIYNILFEMRNSFNYQFIKDNILLPIVNFDSEYNGELLKTLYIYSVFDSVSKVAEYLHIHVNTVRYRLEKLKDITGKNIYDNRDKKLLYLATVISDLEHITSEDWRKCHNIINSDY